MQYPKCVQTEDMKSIWSTNGICIVCKELVLDHNLQTFNTCVFYYSRLYALVESFEKTLLSKNLK